MSALTERALMSERVARQVAQIEAQSRGIYAAQNPEQISQYAAAMADNIAAIEKQMTYWEAMLPPDVRQSFAEQVKAPMLSYFNTRRMVASTALKEGVRSEEHTSELQSLMRISYAVFCLKKKTYTN